MPKKLIKSFIRKLPYGEFWLTHRTFKGMFNAESVPPGHFYSAVPLLSDIEKKREQIFSRNITLQGIDLNTAKQIQLLKAFSNLHQAKPFDTEGKGRRFNINNPSFSYDDAPVLHYFMRLLQPKRIIEIGAGFSSACMLDTSQIYLNNKVEFTFIDLDCDNLRMNLLDGDRQKVALLESPVQDVDITVFKKLAPNDLLFIDSSHVLKTGSDLHKIFFEILPILNAGVYIHLHDIAYPFQPHESIIRKKLFWNEPYFLRAFLINNADFEIAFWLNYLINCGDSGVQDLLSFLPLERWQEHFGAQPNDFSEAGGSIYLHKQR